MHPAARLQFERVIDEYAKWRAIAESERPPAPAWWWGPSLAVRELADKLPPAWCARLGLPGGASYAGFNSALSDLAKSHDNLRIVDWAGLVSGNRGWLAGDGVHVNATGYAARARAIAKQVERC